LFLEGTLWEEDAAFLEELFSVTDVEERAVVVGGESELAGLGRSILRNSEQK
jgi:hypothetical protein